MTHRQIYLDCDGVLADFDAGFEALFGRPPNRENPHMRPARMWKTLEEHGSFYADLPLMNDAMELFEAVAHLRPIILTGCPRGNWAITQKLKWRDKHFKGVPMITCMSKDKRDYCRAGDVLVDDWPKYRDLWVEVGGTFILHTGAKASIAALKEIGAAQ